MSSSKSYGKSSAASRRVTFFVPGDGIDREVISTDICRYLGNDATTRPGEYTDTKTGETTKGFYVTAYRALTTEQLADIKADSLRWAQEKRQPLSRGQPSGGSGDGYRQSATRRQQWSEGGPETYSTQREPNRQPTQSTNTGRYDDFPQQTFQPGGYSNQGPAYTMAAALEPLQSSYASRPTQPSGYATNNVARTQPTGGYSYTATAQQPTMSTYSYGTPQVTTTSAGMPPVYAQQQPRDSDPRQGIYSDPRDSEMFDYDDNDDYQESAPSKYGRPSTREPDPPRREDRSHRDRERERRHRH